MAITKVVLTRVLLAILVAAPFLTSSNPVVADQNSNAQNYALVWNQNDDSARFRARVDLNVLKSGGLEAALDNVACASNGGFDACWPSCTFAPIEGCIDREPPAAVDRTSVAVALQLNLYEGAYQGSPPLNFAVAKNEGCTGCAVYANAVQSSFAVDYSLIDLSDVEKRLERMDRTLEKLGADLEKGKINFDAAIAEVQLVVNDFCALAVEIGGGCQVRETAAPS